MYFLLQNRLNLLMKEHLYSTSFVIVTVNRGMDDNVSESIDSLKKIIDLCQ